MRALWNHIYIYIVGKWGIQSTIEWSTLVNVSHSYRGLVSSKNSIKQYLSVIIRFSFNDVGGGPAPRLYAQEKKGSKAKSDREIARIKTST